MFPLTLLSQLPASILLNTDIEGHETPTGFAKKVAMLRTEKL